MTEQSSNAASAVLRGLCLLALPLVAACVDPTGPKIVVEEMDADAAVEPQSGIATDALVAVSELKAEKLFVVFYLSAKIGAQEKAAAPGKLCASRGLKVGAVEDKSLEHPSEMPGARKLVVRCT